MRTRLILTGVAIAAVAATSPGATAAPRIVGGSPASAGEYPYMVALIDPLLGQFCGGTLVKASYVVTAAHCTAFVVPGVTRALIGTNTINSGGISHIVAAHTVHPAYNAANNWFDVAVLRLLTPSVQTPLPYAAPAQSALWAAGTSATIVGWGATKEGGNTTNELREASVPIVSDADCARAYGSVYIQSSFNVCAGRLGQGGVDTCQGDSGGPLMVKNGTAFLLAGITSWGIGCAEPEYPGVYTEVATMKTFIDAATLA